MKKSWIVVIGAAFVGMALAAGLLLIVPMNTGGDVDDYEREAVDGPQVMGRVPVDPAKPVMTRPQPDGTEPTRSPVTNRETTGRRLNEDAVALQERRAQPDAVWAGKCSAPWSLVRRTLLHTEDPFGKEVLEQSAGLIQDLRQARRDPDAADFADLEARQTELVSRIRASEFGSDPQVSAALDRLDNVFAEYHEATGE
jgi:hypothetical protein